MRDAVLSACAAADALVMAAAPADFTPPATAAHKIKKDGTGRLALELEETPDILKSVHEAGLPVIRVAFAAETQRVVEYAREKLLRKGVHLIAANDVTAEGAGFGTDTNLVTILDAEGRSEELPLLSKYDVAIRILDRIVALLGEQRTRRMQEAQPA